MTYKIIHTGKNSESLKNLYNSHFVLRPSD